MNPLTFTLRSDPTLSVDLKGIRQDTLVNKTKKSIAQIQVRVGKNLVELGDLFEITGEDCRRIVFKESCSSLINVGSELKEGELEVFGDLGAFAGSNMSGGCLTIHGSVGDFAASSITGGVMRIFGDAGDYLASSRQGNLVGMNNGFVFVEGCAGARVADRMRRGTVVVKGSCGTGAGSAMIAGTVILLDGFPDQPGIAMRRGTIICQNQPRMDQSLFEDQGEMSIGFMALLSIELQKQVGFKLFENRNTRIHRYVGDRSRNGIGEILVLNC